MKVNNVERWLRLAFGLLVLLFAGIIYAWSILNAPFAKPLAEGGEFGWNSAQLGLNYTLTIVFFCLGGFAAGLLTKKTSARTRILTSAVLLFAGFFVTSRLPAGSGVLPLYLSYGVASGVGVGFTYTTIIGLTTAWFPDKKGLASGTLLMGFGLTSLIIGNIADIMIKAESIGWRTTYLIIAIAIGVILAVAAFIIKPPPAGTIFPEAKSGKKAVAAPAPAKDYTALEMIRRPSFWLLFIFITLLASVGSAAISFAKQILGSVGAAAPAVIVGIISVFNGLGRLVSGVLFDNLGIRKTQYVMSGIAILAPVTIVLATNMNSLAVGIIGLALCYFSYGFAPTTASVFASNFYGPKNFSLNFSIVNLILIPAPFAATLAGNLYKSSGSFTSTFMILIACSVAGLLVNLGIKKA